MVSGDGINLMPNDLFDKNASRVDWPHLDQTDRSDIYKCIQGQAVLTNTTASFVASPGSHLMYVNIMNKYKIPLDYDTNWWKISCTDDVKISQIKKMVIDGGGKWQIPILAPAGSFIIWSSSLIHSARFATQLENPSLTDKWLGWRCVVYVSYRPKEEYSEYDIMVRQEAYEDNLTTNHWGTKTFKNNPTVSRFKKQSDTMHEKIKTMINNPKSLYYSNVVKPNLSNDAKLLLGYTL